MGHCCRGILRALVGPLVAMAALGAPCLAPSAAGQVFLTQEEALDLAFPLADGVERRTAFLTDEQAQAVEAREGSPITQRVVTHYLAHRDGEWLGGAWFDVHRVRTLDEVLMVVVSPEGRVGRVEVVRFAEPRDYLAPSGWLDQFNERVLDDELDLKGEIVNMTGATLTSQAVTDAVRRVLALHEVVAPLSEPPSAGGSLQ